MQIDTEEFVQRLREGESVAWQQFFREHGRLIWSVAGRLGLGREDAEEVFQNTCIICHETVDRLRDPSRLPSWIYRIAYRQTLAVRNRSRRAQGVADADEIVDRTAADLPSMDNLLVEFEVAAELQETLDEVGPPCSDLIRQLYLTAPRPSYEEISESLDMPIGSIGPTRARCLERLRKRLARVSGSPEDPTQESEEGGRLRP